MKKILASLILVLITTFSFAQAKKIELFDLIKKIVQDSIDSGTPGDWSVGSPATFPVQWQGNQIEMSDDLKINFFRRATANITVNGMSYVDDNKITKWNIMLKGPRSGFTNFSISSPNSRSISPKLLIDSLLGKKQYSYKLLQRCDGNPASGFYYYLLTIPKKVTAWLKIGWVCKSDHCVVNLDCYDNSSKQYAELGCPGR